MNSLKSNSANPSSEFPPNRCGLQKWSPETVSSFWDFWGKKESLEKHYFSNVFQNHLYRLAGFAGMLKGRNLDYGSGPGFLSEKLATEHHKVMSLEFSARSLARTKVRAGEHDSWEGGYLARDVPTTLESNSFDSIYLIEVVEHLLDEWLEPNITEVFRLCRPGGRVMITTPNSECLEDQASFCPFCEATFHYMQHVQSFTASRLGGILEDCGFRLLFCEGIRLQRFRDYESGPWSELSLSRAKEMASLMKARLLDQWSPRDFPMQREMALRVRSGPHLVAIAEKPI